jgi:hypothetical protein
MDERAKEEIKYSMEVLRLSVVALLTIGGGVVSLILTDQISGKKSFFIAFGMVLMLLLIILFFNSNNKIKRLIK